MIKLLKDAETRELEKAKKEAEAQHKKIAAIEQKQRERQVKIDRVNEKYHRDIQVYENRMHQFLINKSGSTRFIWFIASYGIHRQKYTDVEWDGLVRSASLEPLMKWIDDLCPPLPCPKRVELSEEELLKDG